MTPFIHNVRETIAKHRMLTPQDRVLAGVSGGADSTALLFALRELGYNLTVAHLNHGLRGAESDEDARFVTDLTERLGIPCFVRSASIDTEAGNVEAAGREARRVFFQSLIQDHGFTKLALAHNREDRVETFLLHLMRGAGSEGLRSMSPVTKDTVRPLIETSRSEIEAFLGTLKEPWRTDSTNANMSFARNRMRHEVIPRLASLFNVQLVETLSRTINILQDEDQWMNEIAKAWLDQHTGSGGIDAAAMQFVSDALSRRLIREALRRNGADLTDITFDHVEAVRSLLQEGKSGKVIHLPRGIVAAREFNRLVLAVAPEETPEFEYDMPVPGTVHIPELGRSFRAQYIGDPGNSTMPASPERVFVDGDRLDGCVKIRNWKPGDYYKPAGWPAGKVKRLFQRARIPRSQRSRWPIFASGSTIIWVTSFPVSREFVPSPYSKKIVAFEALES